MRRIIFTFLCLLPALTCQARTIIIDANGSGDYPTIQAAIDDSNHGDTIILTPGTYTGPENRDIDFKGKAITVRSTDPNDPNIVTTTIIDCEGTWTDSHRGFYFHNNEDANSVLSGLTVTHGFITLPPPPPPPPPTPPGPPPSPPTFGGGIYCKNSSPTITNCTVVDNRASHGGGISCQQTSSPVITNCTITNNGGRGIYCGGDSNPTITNSTITNNHGGGIACYDSNPTLTNCIISRNSALLLLGDQGAGIYCDNSSPKINNCTINRNFTSGDGGGIYCRWNSNPTITNSIISNNSAYRYSIFGGPPSGYGGGIYCSDSNPTITNSTIISNSAGGSGGGVFKNELFGLPTTITNSIVWDNSQPQIAGLITVTYSNVQDGWEGVGNIGEDPLLTWDGHLQIGSPCINSGDPNYTPAPDETDIDSEARIMDSRIDIGSDEFLDTDSDGLPDWWEDKYFSSPTAANPADDSDNDGWTNLNEYVYYTVPNTAPTIYYVDPNGMDTYDGLAPEWDGQHGPKQSIQTAIDACADRQNDIVILAQGIYTGYRNKDIYFYGKAITVQSTNPNDPCTVAATIIDCQGTERSLHRAFNFEYYENPTSVITGLTITNGYVCEPTPGGYYDQIIGTTGGAIFCSNASPTITNCVLTANHAEEKGGAIYCEYSSPIISNCIIKGNLAGQGGGIFCYQDSNPTVTNCTIRSNSAEYTGGGIYCWGASLTVADCTIIDNSASEGYYPRGGGIYCTMSSKSIITNCTITGNSADSYGGGVICSSGNYVITNCTIAGNSANTYGGAICCFDANSIIANCKLIGNSADCGGGILCWTWEGSRPIITNCTFIENYAPNGNALACDSPSQQYPSNVQLNNCILWDGGNEIWNNDNSTINITYSDIQGGYEGIGNIDTDPCFVEPGCWADANDPNIIVEPNDPNAVWIEGDYHLYPFSLCINTGDPNYIPEPNETDLDGNPRVIAGRIDMGAYESNHIHTRLWILPRTINRQSRQKRVMAWLRLPQGITKDQIDSNAPLLLYPGQIEPTRQFIFQQGRRRRKHTSIIAFFDKTDLMDVLSDNGRVKLYVVGNLKTGRYFYGSDTIRIISRPRRSRWHRPKP